MPGEPKRKAGQGPTFGTNALLNAMAWLIPAAAMFIAVPITVRGLGSESYGLLVLVSAISGYLGLTEMGLGLSIVRYLSYFRALDDGQTMLAILRFAMKWFLGVGLLGGALLFVGAPWVVESILHISPAMQPTAITVVRLAAINFPLGMLVSRGVAIPQSFLRYDIVAGVVAFLGTANAVGPAVLVMLGFGIEAIIVFQIAANIAGVTLYSVFGLRLLRSVSYEAPSRWREFRRRTIKFAGVTALSRIHGVAAIQTSRIVVGALGGASAAAYYQVPALMAGRTNDMLNSIATVLFPTGTGMIAKNDHEGVVNLYLRTTRLFFVLNCSVSTALCVFARPLLYYWISPRYAEEGTVALVLFTLAQALNATTMAAGNLNSAHERPGINLRFGLTNSLINIGTVYPMTVHFGVTGAAATGLFGATVTPFFIHYSNRHVLGVSSRKVVRAAYLPTLLGAAICGLPAYLVLTPIARSLLSTLLLFTAVVCGCMAVSGLLGAISRKDLVSGRRAISGLFGLRFAAER